MERLVIAILLFSFTYSTARAWPYAQRVADINGDCLVSGVVLGDSFVSGVGDTRRGSGYVKRAQSKVPDLLLREHGYPGIKTRQLFVKVRRALRRAQVNTLGADLLAADFVVLDVGRNDHWLFGEPEAAARNIKRIRKFIQKATSRHNGIAPVVVTAVLMLPNRGAQAPWVRNLNHLISRSHSRKHPANLRFDKLSKSLLSSDNLHPSPKGYQAIANKLVKYVKRVVARTTTQHFKDSDLDGLADVAETMLWHADPFLPDTDGDGHNDGMQYCFQQTESRL